MSDKKRGRKIVIKFDKALVGDVTTQVPLELNQATGKSYSASHGVAANAYDENASTVWQPGYRLINTWVRVDLGSSLSIYKVFAVSGANHYTVWRLEGSSDDSDWTTVVDGGHTAGSQEKEYEFSPVSYRYWRIYGVSRSGNYPGFRDIRLFQMNGMWITGNEQEPKFSSLTPVEYLANSINRYLATDDTIELNFAESQRFNNAQGNLTVHYDENIGSLTGAMAVESFEKVFTPLDLEGDSLHVEHLSAGIDDISVVVSFITYLEAFGEEHLSASIEDISIIVTKVGTDPL